MDAFQLIYKNDLNSPDGQPKSMKLLSEYFVIKNLNKGRIIFHNKMRYLIPLLYGYITPKQKEIKLILLLRKDISDYKYMFGNCKSLKIIKEYNKAFNNKGILGSYYSIYKIKRQNYDSINEGFTDAKEQIPSFSLDSDSYSYKKEFHSIIKGKKSSVNSSNIAEEQKESQNEIQAYHKNLDKNNNDNHDAYNNIIGSFNENKLFEEDGNDYIILKIYLP